MNGYKPTGGFRNDPVYFVGITLAALALVAAICLALIPPSVLRKLIMPAAMSIYSPDGMLEQATLNTLDRLMTKMWAASLLLSFLFLAYTLIWRYFSLRLPSAQSETVTPSISKISTLQACFLLLVILIGLILRLHGITRGLTFDEIWTAVRFVEVDSIWKTVSSYQNFNNHIAYSVLAKTSQSIFGRHEWTLRLPALLIGLGTLYYLWVFGRSLFKPTIALAASLCLALSPTHVLWSKSARGYSGLVLFTLVSTHLYLRLLRRPTIRFASMFVIASAIGTYFHLYAGFVTMVQIVFFLYFASYQVFRNSSSCLLDSKSFRFLWLCFPAIIGVSLILHAPVLPALTLNILTTGYRCFQPLFPLRVINDLSGNIGTPFQVLLLLLFMWGLISLRSSRPKDIPYFPLLLLFPLSTAWLFAPYHLYTRFFVYFIPYYVLFIVSGFFMFWNYTPKGDVKARSPFLNTFLVVLAVVIMLSWSSDSWRNVPEGGFRPAVRAMEIETDGLVGLCAIGGGSAHFYQYYSEREILVPSTLEEFQQIVERYPEIWCAYHAEAGEPSWQTELVNSLSKKAKIEKFGQVIIFRFEKSSESH